ncbi:MAG: hypothetical protein IH840_14810 [Candidatus Heimdallarchaeota archaeon]|nr:hypothetical protein [Candidatus Heimdallarchaeota archaeon]
MVTLVILSINLIFGLLTTFSPCLFPLLPTYLAIISSSGNSLRKRTISVFALMLGVFIVFFVMSIFLNATISRFLILNYVTFARFQAILLILSGYLIIQKPSFLSKIQVPNKFYQLLYDHEDKPSPIKISFMLGLFYTIIAAPCAGGYFITIWLQTLGKSIIEQVLLILVFSIGVGLPFLVFSVLFPSTKSINIPGLGATSNRISIVVGIILILSGFYLFLTVYP